MKQFKLVICGNWVKTLAWEQTGVSTHTASDPNTWRWLSNTYYYCFCLQEINGCNSASQCGRLTQTHDTTCFRIAFVHDINHSSLHPSYKRSPEGWFRPLHHSLLSARNTNDCIVSKRTTLSSYTVRGISSNITTPVDNNASPVQHPAHCLTVSPLMLS